MSKPMIVKVQLDATGRRTLTYNKDWSVLYESDITDDVRDLMGKRRKLYVFAELRGTVIHLGVRAPDQKW